MPSVLSILPFFGGKDPVALEQRLDYLARSVLSVRQNFGSSILVGVCDRADEELVKRLDCQTCLLPSISMLLPAALVAMVQRAALPFEYLYYSEGDQIVHFNPSIDLFALLDHESYVAPHRFEKLYHEWGADRGVVLEYNGDRYVAVNNQLDKTPVRSKFYNCSEPFSAFGGAYLCSKDLFSKIEPTFTTLLPIEHASGFDIFDVARFKLKSVDFFDFFVEHLSGYDNHKKLAGSSATAKSA